MREEGTLPGSPEEVPEIEMETGVMIRNQSVHLRNDLRRRLVCQASFTLLVVTAPHSSLGVHASVHSLWSLSPCHVRAPS